MKDLAVLGTRMTYPAVVTAFRTRSGQNASSEMSTHSGRRVTRERPRPNPTMAWGGTRAVASVTLSSGPRARMYFPERQPVFLLGPVQRLRSGPRGRRRCGIRRPRSPRRPRPQGHSAAVPDPRQCSSRGAPPPTLGHGARSPAATRGGGVADALGQLEVALGERRQVGVHRPLVTRSPTCTTATSRLPTGRLSKTEPATTGSTPTATARATRPCGGASPAGGTRPSRRLLRSPPHR
jgi:hypothetical protein